MSFFGTSGGTGSLSAFTTDDLPEGSSNQYYTNERVDDRVAALIQNGTGLAWTYVDGSNTLTGDVSLASFSTSDLAQGSNLYFTEALVLGTDLAGFSSGAGSISAADTVLSAFNKLDGNVATKQPLDAQLTSLAALSFASNTLKVVRVNAGETDFELATLSAGDFSGPASSVDNTLVRFDGTGGKTGQASTVVVDDNGAISNTLTGGTAATLTLSNGTASANILDCKDNTTSWLRVLDGGNISHGINTTSASPTYQFLTDVMTDAGTKSYHEWNDGTSTRTWLVGLNPTANGSIRNSYAWSRGGKIMARIESGLNSADGAFIIANNTQTNNTASPTDGGFRVGGVYNYDYTISSTTAAATEQTLKTLTLPANFIWNLGDALEIEAWGRFGATANGKIVRLYFGSQVISTSGSVTINDGSWHVRAVVGTIAAGNTQSCSAVMHSSDPTQLPAQHTKTAGTQTITSTIVVKLTGENLVAAAADVTCDGWAVSGKHGRTA